MQVVEVPPGRGGLSLKYFAFGIALAAVLLGIAFGAFRNSLALGVLQSFAHGLGYDVATQNLDVTLGSAVAREVRVRNAAGEPVFEALAIDVKFSLRDLLPGGSRLFGLTSVDIIAPHVTVIHHPDGSYNITAPPAAAARPQAQPPPLDITLRIRGGAIDLKDRFVAAPRERVERISGIHARGVIGPSSGAYYNAGAVLEDRHARYPIFGNARFDDPRGFELQHWTAAKLAIADLANFVLSSHAVVVQSGEIRKLDVKLGALSTPAGAMQSHFGASGELVQGRLSTAALIKPVRDARGSFDVNDNSATIRSLDATLNGIALHLRGSIFNFAAPHVAFALSARGNLRQARELSKDSAKLPVGGAIAVQGLVEGTAANPVVFAQLRSAGVTYGAYRLDQPAALAAIAGNELDVIAARLRYGPIDVGGRAALLLQRHTQTTAYATLRIPANAVPYVANVIPGLPLDGLAEVNGTDARLAVRGYLAGANGTGRLDAPFAIGADASGTVGPVVLQRRDGASIYARAAIGPQAKQTVALVDIRRLSLLPASAAALPGVPAFALPAHIDATVDATLAGVVAGSSLAALNGSLHGYGSWGDVHAGGGGSARGYAARGRLTSTFERLKPFTGAFGARGGIDIPFALTSAGPSTVVQIADARFPAASIRGVALQSASATLGIALPAVNIYAADLRVADHAITAMGRYGNGGRIRLTAGDFDLRAARAAGVPLSGGRATVIADFGGTFSRPTANVLAALAGARYAHADVGGNLGVAYDGNVLHIERATATFGGAYANASGAVSGLHLGQLAPHYDINTRLEDADITTLARTYKNSLRYPAGTLNADFHLGGAAAKPAFSGEIRIPEGSLNGLYFHDARLGLDGTGTAIRARRGRVTIGNTGLAFSGAASAARQSLSLQSQRLNLADFNDYFDEAEVLAGTGAIAFAVDASRHALNTTANLTLRGSRYRRFELGTVDASLRTTGNDVHVKAALDGTNGRVHVAGGVSVPPSEPLRDIARRSYVDMSAQIAALNLGNVLPAAGINAPVVGFLDLSAAVRGRYPALALTTHAALVNAVAGRIPIERFTLAATAVNGHGRLTDATLIAPGLTANVTGRFGVRPADPFDLRAQADSSDIDMLITSATGHSPGVKGTLATRTHLTGTMALPQVASSIDVTNLSYASVTLRAAHADLNASRKAVEIRNGNVLLPRGGAITFDGRAPLGDGASTPIAFDFAPRAVDVAPYSSLLPDKSELTGIFDGNVGVRGTPAAPRLMGNLQFRNGSYRSNTLNGAFSAIALSLDFSGTTVHVAKLHVHAAPGNIDGSGALVIHDLRDPIRGLSAKIALTIANARISAPKYYVGYVDGSLTAAKQVAAPLTVGGNVTFSSARVPYTALLPSGGSSGGAAPALPDVAFDLGVNVGRDVRIQSGPVDVGASGSAQLGGNLAAPTLDGQFTATDGTVSLYRTFVVQNGSAVNFNPSDGITPSVDATAVTTVPDPPTDVLLHVTGLSTRLNLAFSSQPAYSQQQILGLLVNAQALGAVSGVAQSGASTGGPSISGIGEGLVNTQLTQKFLQPFSSKLGGALGLSDLNLNYNTNGAVSASARRRIGKNISFTYGEQIGGPTPRTSVGLVIGDAISGAQLTFFQAAGTQQAFGGQALTPFLQSGFLATSSPNYTLQAIEPPTGSGFVFSYQRHFW